MLRRGFKVLAFAALLAVILYSATNVFNSVLNDDHPSHTAEGFYKTPENTIEVVALGQSIGQWAVAPWIWYDRYGIAGYNMSTTAQPVMASYYWMREVHRRNPQSLKTVVFDVFGLFSDAEEGMYRVAFDLMHFSRVKLAFLRQVAKNNPEEAFSYLFPLYRYHGHWSELESKDFQKRKFRPDTTRLGHFFVPTSFLERKPLDEVPLGPILPNPGEAAEKMNPKSLDFVKRMIGYCERNGLNLVLVKLPLSWWSSKHHKAVEDLARQYGLRFLDFNEPNEYRKLQRAGFVFALDQWDGVHASAFGAEKLSSAIGEYLRAEGLADDIRSKPVHLWYEKQRSRNEWSVWRRLELDGISDVGAFLSYAKGLKGVTTVVSVRDEGAGALSAPLRGKFKAMGLEKLADLHWREPYVAVMEEGKVREKSGKVQEQVELAGKAADGTAFSVLSAGKEAGDRSSVLFGGAEKSPNQRGLNIVLYSNATHADVYRANFDTCATARRNVYPSVKALREAMAEDPDPSHLPEKLRKLHDYLERVKTQYTPQQEAFLKP